MKIARRAVRLQKSGERRSILWKKWILPSTIHWSIGL